MLAPVKLLLRSIIKNAEAAALDKGEDVAAAKAEGGVGIEDGVGEQAGLIVRRIDGVLRQHNSPPGVLAVSHGKIGINRIRRSVEGFIRWHRKRQHFNRA